MRIQLLLAFFLILLVSPQARAQEAVQDLPFWVDRPGFSDYPSIVPKGWLQFETGFEYYQREKYRALFLPTLMVRTAITKGLELRMINRFLRIDSTHTSEEDENYYHGAVEAKVRLISERGWRPAVSALGGFSLTPETTRKLKGPIWGNYALLLLENHLSDKVMLNYNAGVTWNRYEGTTSGMYSLAFELDLSSRHAVFIEQSTFFKQDSKNDHWVNLGYTYLVGHKQIDFSGGINFNGGSDDYFFAVGYSTRIPLKANPDN